MELTASTALSRGPSGSSRRSASPPGSSKLVTVGHALSAVSTGPCCDEAMLCGSPNALCCEDDACLEGAAQATAGESCGTEGACTCEKDGKGKQKADGVETCVECRQAMVGGCTEDCFNPPREDDCAECEKVDTSGCSVPGCQEVEWDEQAVDELLKCCCSSESHHHSFATPYPKAPPADSATIEQTGLTSPDGQSSSQPKQPAINLHGPDFSFAAPVPVHHNHAHQHFHAAHHHFPDMPNAFDAARSDLSTSNSSGSTFTFSSPALSSMSTQHHSPDKQGLSYLPQHHYHSDRSHPSGFGNGNSSYRCQWSDCTASFPSREELVGHVNVTHLLHAQSAGSIDVQSHPGVFMPSGDAALDSTLRCLWDSCEAALPVVGNSAPLAHSIPLNGQASTAPAMATSKSQDTSTATLVRHLLQDHLHLPADLLAQLEASVALPQGAQSKHVTGQAQDVQYLNHEQPGRLSTSGNLSAYSSPGGLASATPPLNQLTQHQLNNAHAEYGTLRTAYLPAPSTLGPSLGSSIISDKAHEVVYPHTNAPSGARLDANPDQAASSIAGEHDFRCHWSGCTASFESTASLMEHVSDDHVGSGKSLYHCHWDGCARAQEGKGFTQRQKIMRHLRTHVGDKPFVCPECHKGFSESTTLAQHIRTHTNEKPFVCPIDGCGKSFAIQSALTIHLRTHSGEKPFHCPHPGCDMSFAESSNLSKHVKTHQTSRSGSHNKRGFSDLSDADDQKAVRLRVL